MKTLKNLSSTAMFVLLTASFGYGQDAYPANNEEPAVIALVSSKNIHDASELIVELEGEIITDTWNKDTIVRIEMEIKATGVTREVVKHLMTKRRFVIGTQVQEDGSVLLFTPNLKYPVYINGVLLSEDISYRLLVPEDMLVRIRPTKG